MTTGQFVYEHFGFIPQVILLQMPHLFQRNIILFRIICLYDLLITHPFILLANVVFSSVIFTTCVHLAQASVLKEILRIFFKFRGILSNVNSVTLHYSLNNCRLTCLKECRRHVCSVKILIVKQIGIPNDRYSFFRDRIYSYINKH
jgi:hypothetical protein